MEIPKVELYSEKGQRELVYIHFGGRIEALDREKAMDLADAIIHALVTDEQSYQKAMGVAADGVCIECSGTGDNHTNPDDNTSTDCPACGGTGKA